MAWMNTKLLTIIRRVKRNIEDYGWKITIRKSWDYLFEWLYLHRVYQIIVIDPSTVSSQEVSGLQRFTFRTLQPKDTQLIEKVEELAEWLQGTVADRIARGDLCVAALSEGELAGFYFVGFGEVLIPLLQARRGFRPGRGWVEHVAVLKQYRRRGISTQLRYRTFEELRKRGCRRLYSGVLPHNLVSLRSALQAGFQPLAEVHFTKVLGSKAWRCNRPSNRIQSTVGITRPGIPSDVPAADS